MMKHTQGLWWMRVSDSDIDIESETSGADLPGVLICSLKRDEGEAWADEVLANANLIAAAPDMIEALYSIRAAFASGDIIYKRKRQSDSDPYHTSNTKLCKAIAKAEHKHRADD